MTTRRALVFVAAVLGRALAAQAPAPASDSAVIAGVRARMIGPFRGGRSTAVAGVPDQPHVFYMGTTGGGVWRSDDAGTTWKNVSDGFFGGSIGAVAVAPSDPNVLYVGEGSLDIRGNTSQGRGAWRSTDGGRTWTRMPLVSAGQIGRIVVHPTNADVAFAAVLGRPFGRNPERGVFRTTDGGRSWQKVLHVNDSTGASDIAMDPRNPRVLYAALWRGERKPWALISGSADGGVWKTTDGGDTWKKLAGGLPTGLVGKIGLSVSRANPDRVYAIVEAEPAGGVYRSDDGGATWTRTNSENKLRQRAWYYTHIRADPEEEHVVYALNTSMYRSVDGGRTFDPVEVPHGDVHDLWINPRDKRVMIVANDGGAQVSLNRGRTWTTYFNQPTAEFYDVITDNGFPFRVYSAQQDNTSISVPAWTPNHVVHPFAEYRYAAGCETGPVALHPDRPQVIWGGCYGGAINRWDTRSDERRNVILYPQLQLGQAAKDLRYRFQWVAPILVSRHDPDVVYHASQHVHRTRDGGMTWETISPDLTTNTPAHQERSGGPINNDITGVEIFNTVFALAEDRRDANVLWAGTDDGRVHVTRDGGRAWSEVTPPGMPRYGTVEEIVLSRHRPTRAYVAAQAYRLDDFRPHVWRTDDGGRTWTRLGDGPGGLPTDHPVRSFAEDTRNENVLYAGTEYGLYVSVDGGRRWTRAPQVPVTPVADLEARDDGLVVATQGRSLYLLDDLTPLRELAPAVLTARAHLFTPRDAHRVDRQPSFDDAVLGPDAIADGAEIHYWLGDSAAVTVDIHDARGQLVKRFTSDSAGARAARTPRLAATRGLQRFVWDLKYPGPRPIEGVVTWGYTGGVKAPPGEYEARLSAGGVTQARRFRLLADPRLAVAQAEYEEQFRVASAVRDSLDAVNAAIATLRSVRDQANAFLEQAKRLGQEAALQPVADTVATKLGGVEVQLTQVKSKSGQDPIRFGGMLDNQLAELYGNLTGVDGYISGGPEGRPTQGALARFGDLNAQWAPLSARLQEILTKDVEALNQAAERLGLGRIVVPPRRGPIS